MSTKKITLPTHFIDLHLHLDGAITLDIAKVLAKLQNQTLPASSDAELSKLLSIFRKNGIHQRAAQRVHLGYLLRF